MKWNLVDGNYFLEYDNTLLISVDTDGNYYLFNKNDNQKYLVGIQGDSDIDIKAKAQELIGQYNLLNKKLSIVLFEELIEVVTEYCSVVSPIYKKLVNARFLPPSILPQYATRYINVGDIIKSITSDKKEKASLKIVELYNQIVDIDPRTQSVATVEMNDSGRKFVIEEVKDFVAKSNKSKLSIENGEKIYECFDEFNSNEEKTIKGFSVENEELYTTIYILFVCEDVYVIVKDGLNNVDEMFKYNAEVQQHVLEFYGIDIASYLNIDSVNEGFMDDEPPTDEPPTDEPPVPYADGTPPVPPTDEDNKFNFDDIVLEHDEEYIQEIEVIQRNIDKIESLPDDIRETDDIQEVYLLLLGKKEQVQKLSDEEKSDEIINKVVDEISSELGEIEGLSNIGKKDDGNDLDNSIEINEGKLIDFKGKLIKPIIVKKFGVFEKRILIGKKSHKINESADIKKILKELV